MPDLNTLGDLLHWSYANLAMAHAAVVDGSQKYGRIHFIIRSRLFKGLQTGKMNVGSIIIDEKLKLQAPTACVYCGAAQNLSGDHIIPPSKGGRDCGDNLVLACRSCNSSKRDRDFLQWWERKYQTFPPLMLLRRYLKLALEHSSKRDVLNVTVDALPVLPFSKEQIPTSYPPPLELILQVPVRLEETAEGELNETVENN